MKRLRVAGLVLTALLLAALVAMPAGAGGEKERFKWAVADKFTVLEGGSIFNSSVTVDDTLDVNGNVIDLDADADTSITADTDDQIDVEINGADELVITASTMNVADMLIDQDFGVENIGLPSMVTASVVYTSTGAVFTVTDGEIWLVHRAIINVTTNFDCTGNDCTLDLGDGNDTDGLLNCADADLQTTQTDYTGAQAGWQGLDGSAPTGDYIVGGPQVYAPSGGDETIDIAIGGTDPAAGEATIYLYYTRLQ